MAPTTAPPKHLPGRRVRIIPLRTISRMPAATSAAPTPTPPPTPTPTPTPTPNPTIQVIVQTTPAGRAFSVDGANYSAAQTFTWTPGSTHTIATTTPQAGDTGVRYYFSSWS